MKEKINKHEMNFNDALLKIANTPKSAVINRHKNIDFDDRNVYSEDIEATKKPPQPD